MREGLIGSFPPLAFLPCQEAGPDIVQNGTFLRTPDHDDGVQHPRSQISTRMTPSLLWILMKSSSPFLRFVSHHGPPAPFVTFTIGLPYFPFLVLYTIVYVLRHHQHHLSLRAISLPSFSCSREETRNQRDGFLTWGNGAGVEADQLTASLPIQLSCSYDGAFLPCLTDETSMNSDYSGT